MLIWKSTYSFEKDRLFPLMIHGFSEKGHGKYYVIIYEYDMTFFNEFGRESIAAWVSEHDGPEFEPMRPDIDLIDEVQLFETEREARLFIKEWWTTA